MPQLDLFSYSTLIISFCGFFFFFLVLGGLFFFFLVARGEFCRDFFSSSNNFHFVGGTRYLEGLIFFLVSREFTIYKFLTFVSQRM